MVFALAGLSTMTSAAPALPTAASSTEALLVPRRVRGAAPAAAEDFREDVFLAAIGLRELGSGRLAWRRN